ncbi:beta-N-acetylhexosaminidase [Proteiniphilum sp. X52]|uniref:beta-N-acetylhexosaminidase n=1 Tax=Proteiniphilum sp. X52 TaxID=2382159 RepID=UPI000F0A3564|nr:beta-N-acetylhexosaminidase [Proteiniphilum sp. X52]RNC63975.1 glycosyl hydrolase family 20 [Proteiniphilum sp. X52]
MKKTYITMKRKGLLFFLMAIQLLSAYSCSDDNGQAQNQFTVKRVSIIPLPVSLEHGRYNIAIPRDATISEDIKGIGRDLLSATLAEITVNPGGAANGNAFIRIYNDNTLQKEGYRITVEDDGCSIYYSAPEGLLWGIQTMRQILLQCGTSDDGVKNIPLLILSDAPKKAWRGFHIDVARHMFTIDYLKKIVDHLSFYKINKLQLHLTDDQGWRVEIKQYPALTEIGAWRPFDEYDLRLIEQAKSDDSFRIDSRFIRGVDQYGGFYTRDELKELVNYASTRGIEVIPEIDMPGHFTAAINAHNDLSCTGEAGWGTEFSHPLCAGKTENYPMIKNIIKEVAELFPGKYFHIGGDEVEKTQWKKCPHCQALIVEKGLNGEEGLQNYFIKEMADYARSLGKEVMAWDDAFIPSEPQELLYTYWRDWMSDRPGLITQGGFQMIFMEWGRFYLSADPSDAQLRSLYEFEFEPQFKNIVKSNVNGFQACVWTEMIPNETRLEYHLFPSLQAFSELAWGSQRNWGGFQARIPWHLHRLEQSGFKPRKSAFTH